MVNTRSQTKMAENADLLALLVDLKKGQEERPRGNEESDPGTSNQLVASLRGSSAEVLQGIPSDKLTDLTTIEKALKARFVDSHLTQFYRTELKTRRQKPGECLQVLGADVERLMSLAYVECPLDVRESLAVQFFIDAIRDEDTQLCTRLMDFKDLKSALGYSMKFEASKIASKISMHARTIRIEDNAGKRKDENFQSLLGALKNYSTDLLLGRKTPLEGIRK
ncbi:hypothetical protein AVEN_177674-1 [Araneus ventricosus]|uniref:Uncharacterized protein n=1 Tax=Araneus ventricosus TaxID=182803 RepID=A0A4Y2TCT6_ARAVE|nr:hypothetical protein AVEN_177674-1 [Araneus ventricosus]